ncbi:MAG: cation:proton antiporter [Candidatus Omnitrophica bacterium]|nr:cation:proton antiporter [Candidatus Omnitrophota bacterium]
MSKLVPMCNWTKELRNKRTMMGRLRWLVGTIIILTILFMVIFCDLPSILKWQSGFVSRCFLILLLCSVFCLYRILRGPTPADRVVAIDILGILIVGFCAILSHPTGREWYIDIGIAWALQSFIGTIALAKYLEGRGFDE